MEVYVFRVRMPGKVFSQGLGWGMLERICKLFVTNKVEPILLSQASKAL